MKAVIKKGERWLLKKKKKNKVIIKQEMKYLDLKMR
jgi:hypothetical protein